MQAKGWLASANATSLSKYFKTLQHTACIFDVDVLVFYGPLTHFRSFWARSVTHTVTGQAFKAVYQYLMHILSAVIDNCPTWNSGRESMAIQIISWPNSTKECCRTWGSNPRPSTHQATAPGIACIRNRFSAQYMNRKGKQFKQTTIV